MIIIIVFYLSQILLVKPLGFWYDVDDDKEYENQTKEIFIGLYQLYSFKGDFEKYLVLDTIILYTLWVLHF